jgi:5'-nucleotidase
MQETAHISAPPLDWSEIDTVLLDMDGTLLDLRFDNWFWQECVPARYGSLHGISTEEAWRRLAPKFRASMGTLDWYCLDFWSRELELDIRAIKTEVREQVRFLPGAEQFLARLKRLGKRRALVTNAHPETLAIKRRVIDLALHLDVLHSTHDFGYPKESGEFWPRLARVEPFDPKRTLFVDDSLPVLRAARTYGVRHLRMVRCPDSGRPPKATENFLAVDRVAELLP